MKRLFSYLLFTIAALLTLWFSSFLSEVANLNFSPLRQPGFFIPQILIVGLCLFFGLRINTNRTLKSSSIVILWALLFSTGLIFGLNKLIVLKSEHRLTKVQSKSIHSSWGARAERPGDPIYLLQVLTVNGGVTSLRVDVSVWQLLQTGNDVRVKSEIGLTHVELIYHSTTI